MTIFIREAFSGVPAGGCECSECWERAWRRHHLALGTVSLSVLIWSLVVTN